MSTDSLHVRVVSPEELLFEGVAASVVAPAWDGKVGVLPGHAPMIALLGSGELSIDRPAGGPPDGIPATLTVVCNVVEVGADTGLPEGYFLDFEGLSFAPVGPPVVGITAFSVGPGGDDDDDDDD